MNQITITSIHNIRSKNIFRVKGKASSSFNLIDSNSSEILFNNEKNGVSFSIDITPENGKGRISFPPKNCRIFLRDKKMLYSINDLLTCKLSHNVLEIKRLSFIKTLFSEIRKANNLKQLIYIVPAVMYRYLHKSKIISVYADRIDKADDNAEVLYDFALKQKDTLIKSYYVIDKSSEDYQRLSQKKYQLIPYQGLKHKILMMICDYFVSSHADEMMMNPLLAKHNNYCSFFNYRFIFLQHGVTKDDISNWLSREKKNIYYFISSSKFEAESLKTPNYDYNSNEIKLTGMPRFDRLHSENNQTIVFMPTWRSNLAGSFNHLTGKFAYNKDFTNSNYYNQIQALISSKKLQQLLKETDYRFAFLPHPNLRTQLADFTFTEKMEVFDENISYAKVIKESAMLITDYSSVSFDFAYQKKPVIYFHFDSGNLQKGYFDYETMGFGKICSNIDEVTEEIARLLHNGMKVDNNRSEAFFEYIDTSNSSRVFHLIE